MDLDNPKGLFRATFFYVGLLFCLRGGQEHRDLSFEQLRHYPDDFDVYDEETYYEYFEFISKNNQHRFKDINSQNKVVKAYANAASRKCLVRILDLYRQKVPSQPKAF